MNDEFAVEPYRELARADPAQHHFKISSIEADHPFMFMVVERPSRSVHFAGRLVRPVSS